jgi:hypothetical protein
MVLFHRLPIKAARKFAPPSTPLPPAQRLTALHHACKQVPPPAVPTHTHTHTQSVHYPFHTHTLPVLPVSIVPLPYSQNEKTLGGKTKYRHIHYNAISQTFSPNLSRYLSEQCLLDHQNISTKGDNNFNTVKMKGQGHTNPVVV